MKEYKSDIYGLILEPEDIYELFKLLIGDSHKKDRSVRIWRGQANVDWRIDSGAYRRLMNNKSHVREVDIISYEKSLLERARHKGYGVDSGILLSDMELLARLQHHGAATRLVDFSKSSLVALWFCVNTVTKEYGLLLGVHTNYLGGEEGYLDDQFKSYSDAIEDLSLYEYPMIIEPPVVSKRIAAQHGVFLYSYLSDNSMGSLEMGSVENNVFVAISPQLKEQSRKVLIESFDLRKETLFPDLDGFSAANSFSENPKEAYRW
ncbi:FRG domain-containing protein [Peribacillus sp. NPDC046944]|uniref:FRG domain-containing protein n=1 Tax=unclassified Peribacillus TaxID=2675266 RepID=UPI003D00381F